MAHLSCFWGALRYEFRMQIHRLALWIPFAFFLLVLFGILLIAPPNARTALTQLSKFSMRAVIINWTNELNTILPILFGVLLADRLPRDRKTHVEELLTTLPGSSAARLSGKYLGTVLATLMPILIVYFSGLLYILINTGNFTALPWGLAAIASVILPGLLFIGAFSIACPLFIWTPVYQFLFVGYWFWGNLFPPDTAIPTLSGTILTPVGGYPASAFFKADFLANTHGQIPPATISEALASIILLILISILVIFALWGSMRWCLSRQ
jgi:ABC-2 type transport system permease protein